MALLNRLRGPYLQRVLSSSSLTVRRACASTYSQKPKLIDLSREVYHRAPAHPFHPPVGGSFRLLA